MALVNMRAPAANVAVAPEGDTCPVIRVSVSRTRGHGCLRSVGLITQGGGQAV